ncbi:MAG: glycerate kinase [Phycisphaerales bacterium]
MRRQPTQAPPTPAPRARPLALIATDKFKGTLTQQQAAAAMARGLEAGGCDTRTLDMADGGEGFALAMAARQTAAIVEHPVAHPSPDHPTTNNYKPAAIARLVLLGASPRSGASHPIRPRQPTWIDWLILPVVIAMIGSLMFLTAIFLVIVVPLSALLVFLALHHRATGRSAPRTIIIESADAIGLSLIDEPDRDPERLSSAPLAQLIAAADRHRPRSIIIGLGGSATVDGGIGMAHALGYRFLDQNNRPLPPIGASLIHIARIQPPRFPSRAWFALQRIRRPARTTIACDVLAPLTGPQGAARLYAPQKGASPEAVERLETGLDNLRRRCIEARLINPRHLEVPGDGAAGGLGFGCRAFLAATLVSGGEMVAERNGLHTAARRADLIITGEGSIDEQSAQGKVIWQVVQAARRAGTPIHIIAGRALPDEQTIRQALARSGAPGAHLHTLTSMTNADEAAARNHAERLIESLCQQIAEQSIAHPPPTHPQPH